MCDVTAYGAKNDAGARATKAIHDAIQACAKAGGGTVYFPAGTPDLNDISGDKVDIAGSVGREVEEETGLTPLDYKAAAEWHCVVLGGSIALMRLLHVDMPGDELRARIKANLAAKSQPELVDVHLVRAASDLTGAMPLFVTAYIEAQLAGTA